jgi:hypothetical protein
MVQEVVPSLERIGDAIAEPRLHAQRDRSAGDAGGSLEMEATDPNAETED